MHMKTTSIELNEQHKVDVYSQGAHVMSWLCDGKEQLFMSNAAVFEKNKALRGGVPIIFPQFGGFGPGQKHGFARNLPWQPIETDASNRLLFQLADSEETRTVWAYTFRAEFLVELNDKQLRMAMTISNYDEEAIEFTCALHSYFRVNNVENACISGLQDCLFWDNGTPFDERYADERSEFSLNAALDRIYFDVPANIALTEQQQTRIIESRGFNDIVVWNPWREGAAQLADMESEEYRHMLCIESAAVNKPISLAPGASWTGEQLITVI